MPVQDVAETVDPSHVTGDLGPLAWVLEELRKSLDGATKSLKRFVREAAAMRGTDLMSVDAGQLRMARQHLYQAIGALEMVGQVVPARVLRSMEAAVQQFILHPEKCSEDAAAVLERANFALVEYLEGVLAGRQVSPVALFPQFRDVLQLVGGDRIHPADLWPLTWRWVDVPMALTAEPVAYGPVARAQMDQGVLKVMKGGDPQAATALMQLCLGLTQTQAGAQPAIFWKVSAGFFDSIARSLLTVDAYVKRAASRILVQYASLARGDQAVSDRLAQDLLFFCAQALAGLPAGTKTPLAEVGLAYRLDRRAAVDYEVRRFGLFDPALVVQARKRIDTVKETWSGVSGGDVTRLQHASSQFSLVVESLTRLLPQGDDLARALTRAIDQTVHSGRPPTAELGVEIATAVLYLEAVFEDLDPNDDRLAERMTRLANRLDQVSAGAGSLPLEPWMEELYRRVSDRQTMGTVVGELRTTLGEVEKVLDQFFRRPSERGVLREVPALLSQMRGVLSVLGLDQASQAVLRMRDHIDHLLLGADDAMEGETTGLFERLGNSLGALGFLIDMLNYQPALAKKLFVFDAKLDELRPLMGRTVTPARVEVDEGLPAEPSIAEAVEPEAEDAHASELPMVEALGVSEPKVDSGILLEVRPHSGPAVEEQAAPHSGQDVAMNVGETIAALDVASAVEFAEAAVPIELAESAASPAVGESEAFVDVTGVAELPEPVGVPDGILAGASVDEASTVESLGSIEGHVVATVVETVAPPPAPEAVDDDFGEEELLDIFLEEAREVVQTGLGALDTLADAPQDLEQQTVLRRAFHTLKGSSRMVGLSAFGEAAWSMEQVLNAWLAEQRPASEDLRGLSSDALHGFARWVEDIACRNAAAWQPAMISVAADALRLEGRRLPLSLPGAEIVAEVVSDLSPEPSAEVTVEVSSFESDASESVPVEEPASIGMSVADLSWPNPAMDSTGVDAVASVGTPSTEALSLAAEQEVPSLEVAELDFDAFVQAAQEPQAPSGHHVSSSDAAASEPAPIEVFDLDWNEPQPAPTGVEFATEVSEPSSSVESFDAFELASSGLSLPETAPEATESVGEADASGESVSMPELVPALSVDTVSHEAEATMAVDVPAEDGAPTEVSSAALADDEQIKVIGSLKIGIPLYNVYLNEADEWSRRLTVELAEWSIEAHRELPESVIALAHSLAGSSATVGFSALSGLARSLEHALEHGRTLGLDAQLQATVFVQAGEEIRRLLHQFAAGFLKEPAGTLMDALKKAETFEVPVDAAAEGTPDVDVSADVSVPSATTDMPLAVASVATQRRNPMSVELLDDDESDLTDVIDPDLFPIFEEEARELLPTLGGALRQWVEHPGNGNARVQVLRVLHTLKGSARLAGAFRLGDLAHRMESEIEALGTEGLTTGALEPLLARLDVLEVRLDALSRVEDGAVESADVADQAAAPEPQAVVEPVVSVSTQAEVPSAATTSGAVALPATLQLGAIRTAASQAVRVRTQLLDRLVNQAGEVMITRSRLEAELSQLRVSLLDLSGNLERLRQQLRDIELQSETQMQSRLALARDEQNNFDPLEFDRFTRVQELTRMMAESVNDVATVQRNLQRTVEATEDDLLAQARQTRELQRDLLRTRMVEFEGISERLYRVVRQSAKDTGKLVKLDITGGAIEMDRGVLDRMTPAFEHLLRNCVAHGIEMADVRQVAGKDPTGHIAIDLRQDGNDVLVEFRDDGAGLNLQRIREKAVQQGLISSHETITEADAANLIFMPGFSTVSEVSELAGRGIGMDVVRTEVQAVGGRIETHTQPGQGTVFRLILPLTTAVTQVVLVRAGGLTVGLPANLVELVRRTTARDLQQAYNSGTLEHGGEHVPFFWSGALLQSSARSQETQGKNLPVVIVRSAAQRVAMHVDQVLGNQEVVVKNLGPQLARLPGLAGMTVLVSGAVVLIYNPVALAAVYGEQVRSMSADHAQPEVLEQRADKGQDASLPGEPAQVPLVLVVDDSITVRRVTQRMLQREGYRVALAADGLQALERLQQERPAVVLSDIEMPRMDGFDLARNIRGDASLRDLPIIMITSRIAEKHREHARELGVNHYLGKPYSEEELLSLIRRYVTVAVASEV